MSDPFFEDILNAWKNALFLNFSDTDKVYTIPIMCCGQEMSEVYQDGKRVMAICQKCKKIWKPGMVSDDGHPILSFADIKTTYVIKYRDEEKGEKDE